MSASTASGGPQRAAGAALEARPGRGSNASRGVGVLPSRRLLGVDSGPETSSQGSARGRTVPLAFPLRSGVG